MSYYVTFYSYKGGVGRTLALVNTAFSLARRGHSVFIWELDLEARSLLQLPVFAGLRSKAQGGTIDILAAPLADLVGQVAPFVLDYEDEKDPGIRMRVLPAGVTGKRYLERFNAVKWDVLFGGERTNGSELLEALRQAIDRTYTPQFVLIDSRTGLTDVGAICSAQLPDTVVLVYTLSHQGIEGAEEVQAALTAVAKNRGLRKAELRLRRLASMVPGEPAGKLAERLAALERVGLKPDFQIPLQASLLLEEQIWTREYPDHPISREFDRLAGDLIGAAPAKAESRETARELAGAEAYRRGKSFEEKVYEVVRLMDFEVTPDTTIAGRQTDFIARERGRFRDVWYVGECKDTTKPVGVDAIDALHTRLSVFRKDHEGAQGLLVSRSGFTAEAREPAAALGIELRTYEELLAGLVDLGGYNGTLIRDVEGQPIQSLYVEPDLWPEERGQKLAAKAYLEEFLADSEAVMLTLLGDYGTGKTWFTRKVAYELALRYRDDPARHRQPIRIDLRYVAKALDLEGILIHHFQANAGRQVNARAILHLTAEGRFVLIFDGFDEMATQADWNVTLENFRQILRAATGQAKIVLTCRSHYFRAQTEAEELLRGEKPQLSEQGTQLYREIFGRREHRIAYLPGFSEGQIQEYLRRACGKRAAEVAGLIEREPSLRDISSRPVLLDMIVSSAPKLARMEREIKVAHLYETYTEEWFQRQDWRLRITREDRRLLVEELAARLWETDAARIHYTALQEALPDLMHGRIKTQRDLEQADYEVRTASFLTRDAEGNYGFPHRSFLEFFLACRLRRLLEKGELGTGLRLRPLSPQVIRFLRELAGELEAARAAAAILELPYERQVSENAFLMWNASAARDEVRPRQIELEGASLAGLVLRGIDLSGANLQKAALAGCQWNKMRLDGADLAGADLTLAKWREVQAHGVKLGGAVLAAAEIDGCDLAGADLRDTDLGYARFWRTGLEGSTVRGAVRDGTGFRECEGAPEAPAVLTPRVTPQLSRWGAFHDVCFSPDGRLVAAATGNNVAIFDAAGGQCRRLLCGHTAGVTSVAWHPHGGRLASASEDHTVRLWDADSGGLLRALAGHEDGVRSVAWCADGRLLASGSADLTVRLWEADSGALLRTLTGHEHWVNSVAWRPDGRLLASASGDHTVRLWEADSGALLRTLTGHEAPVRAVAWRPDGRLLASASGDHTVRLWEADSGGLLRTLTGHEDGVLSVAWRADGHLVASASEDKTVRVWEADCGALLRTLTGHEGGVRSVAWRADGRLLASAGADRTARLWEADSGALLRTLTGHEGLGFSVAWRADGRLLASASDDNTVRLWVPDSGALLRTLTGHQDWVRSVAWRADGCLLASASDDNTVRLWNPDSGALLRTLTGHEGLVLSVAWRADGRLLASASVDNTVRLWDPDSGALLRTLTGHEGTVFSVAWRADGRLLASASADKTVRLWESGALLRTLTGHEDSVLSVAWRADGHLMASGSPDNTVRLWDPDSGALLRTLTGHEGPVWSVAWHADRRLLASASEDQTVRLWDPDSGTLLRTLTGHEDWVRSVAWRADGRVVASLSDDNTVRLWDPDSGSLLVTLYSYPDAGWAAVTRETRFAANEAGKRYLKFLEGWAIYPAEAFPELEDPGAVAAALRLHSP